MTRDGKVQMFTDGACRGNPGPGGWGVVLRYGDKERQLFGGHKETTNNRGATCGYRGLVRSQASL